MRIAMLMLVAACAVHVPAPVVVEAPTTVADEAPAAPVANDEVVGACANVTGTWEVSGCGDDVCRISQTGCSTSLSCAGGARSYSGSVSGNRVTYSGQNVVGLAATCNATVRGGSMTGWCTPAGLPSCPFTARRE